MKRDAFVILPVLLLSILVAVIVGCKREERGFKVDAPSANTIKTIRLSDLQPGPASNVIATNIQAPTTAITNVIATNSPASSTNSSPPGTTNSASSGSATNGSPSSTNAASASQSSTPGKATNVVVSSAPPAVGPVKNEYEENAFALAQGQKLYSYFNCVGCHANGGGGIGPALMDDKWIYGHNPEQVFATIVQGRPNGMPAFQGRIPDYQVWQIAAYVRSMSGLVPQDAAMGRQDHMSGKQAENSKKPEQAKNSSLPKSAEMP